MVRVAGIALFGLMVAAIVFAAVTWGTMAAIGLAVVLGGVLLRRPPHGA